MLVVELNHKPQKEADKVLVLGFFDGVHLGHQKVIQKGRQLADEKGLPLAVLTFNHHPSIVFKKQDRYRYLSNLKEKEALFADLGVDILYIVPFTSSFAKQAPQTFVNDYIISLGAKEVVVGFDYTYGASKTATAHQLPLYANQQFNVHIVGALKDDGCKVSSTAIRQYLEQGEIEKANYQLGRIYTTHGLIIHGDARGRTLGYPTANIEPYMDEMLPSLGIYAVEMKVQNTWYQGMASIGHNITFGHFDLSVEIHLFDFDQEIYGEEVTVRWYHRLRSEKKFKQVTELIEQLNHDEMSVRQYFKERDND